jgi:hypothetical protein
MVACLLHRFGINHGIWARWGNIMYWSGRYYEVYTFWPRSIFVAFAKNSCKKICLFSYPCVSVHPSACSFVTTREHVSGLLWCWISESRIIVSQHIRILLKVEQNLRAFDTEKYVIACMHLERRSLSVSGSEKCLERNCTGNLNTHMESCTTFRQSCGLRHTREWVKRPLLLRYAYA